MFGYPYNLKARRINFLHYLANRKDDEMLKKFFQAQWRYPTSGDWTEQVKQDLEDFEIECDLDFLRSKSKESFTNIVKRKATEYALYTYLEKKNGHSKLDNLFYSCLSTQEYLTNSDLTVQQAQLIFKYRVRMANYSENFRGYSGHTPCPLCLAHLDSQAMCMTCPTIRENVTIEGSYTQIFTNKITKELVKTVEAVDKYRDGFLQSRYFDNVEYKCLPRPLFTLIVMSCYLQVDC